AEPLLSYTIATAEPNATVAPVHNRMPVLLAAPEQWNLWLDQKAGADALAALLRPAANDLLEDIPVTRDLLKIKEPGPEVLEAMA
ncbi:MAG TPA: SOS response-associated peptidase family protein, partial [Stellaceae bacterium]|nr:SOS response-associated peptidase family protein [Stellaceae bacterium]